MIMLINYALGKLGEFRMIIYMNGFNFSLEEDREVIRGSLEAYGLTLLNEIKEFEKNLKIGGLGPDFHIWALLSQNSKMALISVWMMIGKSFSAQWKGKGKHNYMKSKYFIFVKNWGVRARTSIFGH